MPPTADRRGNRIAYPALFAAMDTVEQPWAAFKVMTAGAISGALVAISLKMDFGAESWPAAVPASLLALADGTKAPFAVIKEGHDLVKGDHSWGRVTTAISV
jgi:hypothetical protein